MVARTSRPAVVSDERGFGMVEVLVSMVIFGIVVVSFLPLLIQTLIVSRENTTVATATQLVSEQIQLARGTAGTCVAMTAFAGATVAPVTDGRNVRLTPSRELLSTCPTVYPGTVKLHFRVKTDNGAVVSDAFALIQLQSAS